MSNTTIDTIDIYTDGSAKMSLKRSPGAWAFVCRIMDLGSIYEQIERTESVTGTTNNRMELMAVWKALVWAARYLDDGADGLISLPSHLWKMDKKIRIFTDSTYVADAFNLNWIGRWEKNNWHGQKVGQIKNLDLWLPVIALSRELGVEYIKTKSEHKGDSMAAIAHRLAYTKMQELATSQGLITERKKYKPQGLIRRKKRSE